MAGTSIQEQLCEIILDRLPFPLAVVDRNLRILLASRAFSAFFQLPDPKRLCQKHILHLIPLTGLKDFIAEIQATQESQEAELQLTLPKGKIRVLKIAATRLAMSESVSAFLLTFEDVGERIWLEQQLVQSKQLAAMEQLAATIAHELGNPLSVITTTLEYVQQQLEEKGEGPFEEIEVILDNVNTMHELLKNLSTFTRLERPHFSFEKIDAGLSQVLAFVAKEAEMHNVTVKTAFAQNLPPCQTDMRQLKQVFLNLFKNALEAMPDGGLLTVTVQAAGKDEWESGRVGEREKETSVSHSPILPFPHSSSSPESPQSVIVQISDTGVGIAEDDLAHIFEPFYSTKPGGMGLGLPISQRIIQNHGGSISVSSQLGAGTTFTITLPSARRSK